MNKKEMLYIIIIAIMIIILGIIIGTKTKNNKEYTFDESLKPDNEIKEINTSDNNIINSELKENNNTIEESKKNNIKDGLIINEKILDKYSFITQKTSYREYIINDLYKKEYLDDISKSEKLYLSLEWNRTNNNKTYITKEFINKYKGKDILSKDGIGSILDEDGNFIDDCAIKDNTTTDEKLNDDTCFYIEEKNVKDTYNCIFDNKFEEIKDSDVGFRCPGYFYDSNYNIYLYHHECGGTIANDSYSYIYDYKESDELISFYIAVGYRDDKSIYKSYITNEIYSNNIYNFQIDNNNYQEFDHFKLTFEKNTEENYIFKSVEKISA